MDWTKNGGNRNSLQDEINKVVTDRTISRKNRQPQLQQRYGTLVMRKDQKDALICDGTKKIASTIWTLRADIRQDWAEF